MRAFALALPHQQGSSLDGLVDMVDADVVVIVVVKLSKEHVFELELLRQPGR